MKKILNIAHRGASAYEPENTLAAFEKAIALGADCIEFDVQVTRDKQIIVYHDISFPDGTLLSNLNAGQIQQKALEQSGIKVPLLDVVLTTLGTRIAINIEIKSLALVDVLIDQLQGRYQHIICSSFIHPAIVELGGKAPEIPRGIVVNRRPQSPLRLLKEAGTELIIQNFASVDKEYVENLHTHKKKIFVWTVNSPVDLQTALSFGVDGIITNYPDVLNALRKNHP
jgi:glycerophosphoryl diester phosphodiesterase